MANLHVKKDDNVVVITGKDKGKKGKIMSADPKKGRIVVSGVNMITRHQKARSQTEPGGILRKEGSISASNVMLYCSKCDKGVRTGVKVLENGNKVRVCKKCGEVLDK